MGFDDNARLVAYVLESFFLRVLAGCSWLFVSRLLGAYTAVRDGDDVSFGVRLDTPTLRYIDVTAAHLW